MQLEDLPLEESFSIAQGGEVLPSLRWGPDVVRIRRLLRRDVSPLLRVRTFYLGLVYLDFVLVI